MSNETKVTDEAELQRQRAISDADADSQFTTHDIPQLLRNIHAEVHVTEDKKGVASADKLLQVAARSASLIAKTANDSLILQGEVAKLASAIATHNAELVRLNNSVEPLARRSLWVAAVAGAFGIAACVLQWCSWQYPKSPQEAPSRTEVRNEGSNVPAASAKSDSEVKELKQKENEPLKSTPPINTEKASSPAPPVAR